MSVRSLAGPWQFRCPHAPRGDAPKGVAISKFMPATMPGTVHYQLQKLGVIDDPFYGRNELDVQWVDQQDWELCRVVSASAADVRKKRQELIFDSLDTVATVYLNGRKVARSVNSFCQVVCDVRGRLVQGKNELRIVFASPTAYADREAKKAPRFPGRNTGFAWETGEKRMHRREWIRKVQCHFGWDWGLFLATSGISGPARLVCSDGPRIAAITTRQSHRPSSSSRRAVRKGLADGGADAREVELEVTTYLACSTAARATLTVAVGQERASVPVRVRPGENRVTVSIVVTGPKLWWPAGHGDPHLYDLEVIFEDDEGAIEKETRRIGFRTLELVTQNDAPLGASLRGGETAQNGKPKGATRASTTGQSFFFRVNGRDIFAKGANWIPPDQFVDRASPAVYRHLLQSMVEANMNMVRVWGGGAYEQDAFYDICDELGLLVWQDFMMACALYPDTLGFIDELTREARYQVRRLHSHPCLALWCGDNENVEGVFTWWKDRPDHRRAEAAYTKTLTALKKVCEAEDTTRRFWLSSPSNDEFGAHPTDPNRGDVHYWKVWHGREPFHDYLTVRPRFVSEFGFQSFPEPRTLRAVVPPEQRNPSSRVMEHHQRSPDGNLRITNTMAREMPIARDFDSFCYISQINQAMAIRTAVEHWRRLRPWCMGTLFWQLDDLWPVASWSSIDYHGRWKVLQHEAARFFAPLLVSLVREDDELAVWATSDVAEPLHLTGFLDVLTWSGRRVQRVPLSTRLGSGAKASRCVARIKLDRLLAGKAEPHEVCCFAELSGDGQRAQNYAPLVPWKWASLVKPRVHAELRHARAGTQVRARSRLGVGATGASAGGESAQGEALELALRTDVVTPFVHAELADTESHFRGDWSVVRPGLTYILPWVPHTWRGAKEIPLPEAKRRLRVTSLYDFFTHER